MKKTELANDKGGKVVMTALKFAVMILLAMALFLSTMCFICLTDLFQPINKFFGVDVDSMKISFTYSLINSLWLSHTIVNLKWNKMP
ncbi:hypothetical protein C1N60_23170 (plasmid) [Pantoea sp. SGAir0184]